MILLILRISLTWLEWDLNVHKNVWENCMQEILPIRFILSGWFKSHAYMLMHRDRSDYLRVVKQ